MADTSTLPRQVREQIARGDQIAREAGLVADPASAATNPPQDPPQPAPAAPQPAAPAPQDPPQPDQPQNWEQRYKSLQGKYDKEVPRMSRELQETRDALRQMQETVRELASVPQQRQPGSYDPADPSLAIDPTVAQEYGDEFFDIVRRVVRQELNPAMADITAAMEDLRRGLVGTSSEVKQTKHMTFLEMLDSQKNNWRTINIDEGFKSWLEEADPLSGIARKHLLQNAVDEQDVNRTLAFFTGYETENGITQPVARKPVTPRVPDTSLEALAAPGAGRPGQPSAAQSDLANEIWTQADITRFYADVRRGEFTGREAERNAIEQRLARAAATGRVRNT